MSVHTGHSFILDVTSLAANTYTVSIIEKLALESLAL